MELLLLLKRSLRKKKKDLVMVRCLLSRGTVLVSFLRIYAYRAACRVN